MLYRFNNITLKYSTGQKVKPKFWNPLKQRVKVIREFSEAIKINEILESLNRAISDGYKDLINSKTAPTVSKLKKELNKVIFKDEFAAKAGFFNFITDLIETSNRRPNTLKQWKQTSTKLKEFKRFTKRDVDFDTIDLTFYNEFVRFLTDEGYTKNSIGGFIKNVKVFMNEAVERRLTKNLEYRNKKFKVIEEQVDKIYLTQGDLNAINELDLTKSKRLEKVRDLFIIACYTGLRFSDLIQVKKDNIINDGRQIRIKTEKTGEVVIIPIHPFVKAVLFKYDGNLPSVISNQKMNEYLKEIAELAKLNAIVKIGITRGGELQHDVSTKAALVSTHTARRSFATNAFLMDMPAISIMKITGHRTEKSFMKYIKITQEENANKLMDHPFFR